MTGVSLMIFSAMFRKESEAQMANRGQNHQRINICFLDRHIPKSPVICFHNCLGTSVLAYAQEGIKRHLRARGSCSACQEKGQRPLVQEIKTVRPIYNCQCSMSNHSIALQGR